MLKGDQCRYLHSQPRYHFPVVIAKEQQASSYVTCTGVRMSSTTEYRNSNTAWCSATMLFDSALALGQSLSSSYKNWNIRGRDAWSARAETIIWKGYNFG